MIFKKREDYSIVQGTVADGGTYRFELTREYPIEAIILRYTVTNGGTAAVIRASSGYTHYDNIRRVSLTVADGARTRNVVDVTGADAIEYAKNTCGVSSTYGSGAATDVTAAHVNTFYIPIWFAHPQIADPVASALLLPAPRFSSNPVLTVQMETLANIYTTLNALAVSNLSVIVFRRDVDDVRWEFWDTEFASQQFVAVAGLNTFELPIPGAFTGMLIQTSTNVTNPLRSNAIFTAAGENRIQYLGNVVRRFRPEDVQAVNEISNPDGFSTAQKTGFYFLDFLTDRIGETVSEIGSTLETNFLMATGARLQLIANCAAGLVNCTFHRIMGDITKLKSIRR